MSGINRPVLRPQHGRTTAAASVGLLRTLWLTPLDLAFRTMGFRFAWMKAVFTHTPPVNGHVKVPTRGHGKSPLPEASQGFVR